MFGIPKKLLHFHYCTFSPNSIAIIEYLQLLHFYCNRNSIVQTLVLTHAEISFFSSPNFPIFSFSYVPNFPISLFLKFQFSHIPISCFVQVTFSPCSIGPTYSFSQVPISRFAPLPVFSQVPISPIPHFLFDPKFRFPRFPTSGFPPKS